MSSPPRNLTADGTWTALTAIALVHVAPGATDTQHIEHSVQKAAVVQGWPRPSTTLGRQKRPYQRPLPISQIATRQNCLL